MSPAFLSYLAHKARGNYIYEKYEQNELDDLSDTISVEITSVVNTDELEFNFTVNKKHIFGMHHQWITFKMNSKGEIHLD